MAGQSDPACRAGAAAMGGRSCPDRSLRDAPAPLRRFTSAELFAGAREVVIEHGGALYRLCRTSRGKLILIK